MLLLRRRLSVSFFWKVRPEVHIFAVLPVLLGMISSVELQPPCIQIEIRVESSIAVQSEVGRLAK